MREVGHEKKVLILAGTLVLLGSQLSPGKPAKANAQESSNIHVMAAECQKDYVPETCDEVCNTCHNFGTGGTLYPYTVDGEFPGLFNVSTGEDPWLNLPREHQKCRECHTAYAENEGNHPIFVDGPDEELLYYLDGKIVCATCHDPHIEAQGLLRISNRGSTLCLECHKM